MYSNGQIIKGTFKDDSESKFSLLVIQTRPSGYRLINVPCCIEVQFREEYFETLDELNDYIDDTFNIIEVIQLPEF